MLVPVDSEHPYPTPHWGISGLATPQGPCLPGSQHCPAALWALGG